MRWVTYWYVEDKFKYPYVAIINRFGEHGYLKNLVLK
jgi:hypothetical protein